MKIILVTIDTLRSDHLGCYGYNSTKTPSSPFIDSLAEQGTLFERHYATDVPTPPSYTSMFFGTRAVKNGIYTFGHHQREFRAPGPPMAQRLYEAGYRTGAMSNLGQIYPWLHQGFVDLYKPGNRFQQGSAEEVTTESLRWLKQHGAGDFFLFAHYWDPHVPYLRRSKDGYRELFSPDEYKDRAPDMKYFEENEELAEQYHKKHERINDPQAPEENLALYDSNIRYTDEWVKNLYEGLEGVGVDPAEALFLITSDHGEAFGEYGFYDHNTGYRNISQVPLIAVGPDIATRRVSAYTQHVDLLPTICELTGLEQSPNLCGESMTSLLTGGPDVFRDEVVVETAFVAIQRMLIREEIALVHTLDNVKRDHIKEYELFDLRSDPDQVNDLSGEQPAKVGEMRLAMQDWISAQTGSSSQDKLAVLAYLRKHNYGGYFARK